MKKSKLTGTLAVGGGLKYAVVPYIITGEENNGYSKGDILDANYVKQLINNVIPNNISADTLELNSGKIITDNGFSVFDKASNKYSIVNTDGFFKIQAIGGLRMGSSKDEYIKQFYSNNDYDYYTNGDTVIMWDKSWLKIDKIHKPTQAYGEKDLFERVSDLETPKTTREDNPKVGQCVFDTTLGKPIWCKTAKIDTTAAVWVDATGATV